MRMTTKITAAVMLMLTLSGCDLPPRLTVLDDRLCRSHGLKPGEAAYATCLTELDMARTGRSCFGSCH
jgi:hypothetical protein